MLLNTGIKIPQRRLQVRVARDEPEPPVLGQFEMDHRHLFSNNFYLP